MCIAGSVFLLVPVYGRPCFCFILPICVVAAVLAACFVRRGLCLRFSQLVWSFLFPIDQYWLSLNLVIMSTCSPVRSEFLCQHPHQPSTPHPALFCSSKRETNISNKSASHLSRTAHRSGNQMSSVTVVRWLGLAVGPPVGQRTWSTNRGRAHHPACVQRAHRQRHARPRTHLPLSCAEHVELGHQPRSCWGRAPRYNDAREGLTQAPWTPQIVPRIHRPVTTLLHHACHPTGAVIWPGIGD